MIISWKFHGQKKEIINNKDEFIRISFDPKIMFLSCVYNIL